MTPDWLTFASALRFPVAAAYKLSFEFELFDARYRLTGIVAGREDEETRYVYTVRLTIRDDVRDKLAAALERRKQVIRQTTDRLRERYRLQSAFQLRPQRRTSLICLRLILMPSFWMLLPR